ncbi:AMP-binding protein, partial [Streptomyces sp. MCAF7]
MPSPQQESTDSTDSTDSTESTVTIGERIGQLAAEHPAATAVLSVAPNGGVSELTWAELERLTNSAARGLAERGVTSRRTVAVALPAGPDFQALYQGLALDHRVIIMERFVPSRFLKLVQEHRVSYVRMVAAMMRMLLDVPGLRDYDLSSIETLHHGAGPCPENVKRAWLELIDPERVYEIYASQERVGRTVIR